MIAIATADLLDNPVPLRCNICSRFILCSLTSLHYLCDVQMKSTISSITNYDGLFTTILLLKMRCVQLYIDWIVFALFLLWTPFVLYSFVMSGNFSPLIIIMILKFTDLLRIFECSVSVTELLMYLFFVIYFHVIELYLSSNFIIEVFILTHLLHLKLNY